MHDRSSGNENGSWERRKKHAVRLFMRKGAGSIAANSRSVARSAMPLARRLGRGELGPAERGALLAAAGRLPQGPIRDLNELDLLPHLRDQSTLERQRIKNSLEL